MAGGIDLITSFIGLETMAVSFYILAGFIKPNQRSNEAAVKYFLLGAFSLASCCTGCRCCTACPARRICASWRPLRSGRSASPLRVARGDAGRRRHGVQDRGGAVPHVGAGRLRRRADADHRVPVGRVEGGVVRDAVADRSGGRAVAERRLAAAVLALAVLTMTVGNVAALTQIERQAHAGVLVDCARRLPADGRGGRHARGVTAMLVYLLVYTFMQLGAFAVVVLLHRRDLAGEDLKDFSGLHRRNPFAAFAMLVFMLSLGGIPPTAGFMGKFWLFGAAIEQGYYGLAVIGVLNSAVSMGYYLRLVVFMYLRTETTGSEPVASPALGLTLGVAVAATLCSACIRGRSSKWRRCRRGRCGRRVRRLRPCDTTRR